MGLDRRRADAAPVERADRHHDHHGDERGHRDLGDQVAEREDQHQQEHAGRQRRQAGPAARAEVDHRLADHGAAGHAAEEAGGDVGDALTAGLGVLVGVGVGQVVEQLRGQQRLEQPDERQA